MKVNRQNDRVSQVSANGFDIRPALGVVRKRLGDIAGLSELEQTARAIAC